MPENSLEQFRLWGQGVMIPTPNLHYMIPDDILENESCPSRRELLSRLNTQPARSPANASTPPLRAASHLHSLRLAGLSGAQENNEMNSTAGTKSFTRRELLQQTTPILGGAA